MKKDLINKIIAEINAPSSFQEKIDELRCEKKHRRGKNKIILSVIIELFDEYALPLRYDDTFNNYYLGELSSKEYEILLTIALRSSCKYFKAICFDIIWEHQHRIDIANEAMQIYFDILKEETNDYRQAALVTAVCRIFSKTKSTVFDISTFHQYCIDSLIPGLPPEKNFTHVIIESLLMSSNSNIIEQYTIDLIAQYENSNMFSDAIYFSNILINFYKKEKRTHDKEAMFRRVAINYEKTADLLNWEVPSNSRRIIHLIQESMRFWSVSKATNASNERKRLTKRIDPIKKISLDSFKSITGKPFDLSEAINQMRTITEKSSFEEIIWNFIRAVKLISQNNVEEEHTAAGFQFSDFFETTVLDSEGRIRSIIPSWHSSSPKERENVLEYEAGKHYLFYANAYISRYLHIIKEKFSFGEEELRFIVESNAFIPNDRRQAFLKGLSAGFDYDYITALSILMPQVENAIRRLAQECGAVVYKTDEHGVEECLSLDSILSLPEIEECLDPDFLFNIKVFFTSDYGLGMRNIVSHGLSSDAEFSSYSSLIVWWFTLHICCIYSPELRKRVSEKRNTNPE